jgi:hypothetical protein
MYPNYMPASVFRATRIGGYWPMYKAGKAYAIARSEDSDGGLDYSVQNTEVAMVIGDRWPDPDAANCDPLRRKVLVFYVNKAPALVKSPPFLPYDGQSIIDTRWYFNLRGMDLDPLDPRTLNFGVGGPTPNKVLRYRITLYGRSLPSLGGGPISWTYADSASGNSYVLSNTLGGDCALSFIPGGGPTMAENPFDSGEIRVSIQICDCIECETVAGQGRCVDGIDPRSSAEDPIVLNPQNVIKVNYTRPASGPGLVTTSSTADRPGSDSSGRRD